MNTLGKLAIISLLMPVLVQADTIPSMLKNFSHLSNKERTQEIKKQRAVFAARRAKLSGAHRQIFEEQVNNEVNQVFVDSFKNVKKDPICHTEYVDFILKTGLQTPEGLKMILGDAKNNSKITLESLNDWEGSLLSLLETNGSARNRERRQLIYQNLDCITQMKAAVAKFQEENNK